MNSIQPNNKIIIIIKKDLFKEIFRLAVRLAGLFFLCVGLKDLVVQTFMALTQAHGTTLINALTLFLPVAFTLTVGLWLLRGTWLIHMAYPEHNQPFHYGLPSATPATPAPPPAERQAFSEMEMAEQKLAALVGKPNGIRPILS